MAGIFGVVSKEGNCIRDLFLGTFYLQHRAQNYCGLAVYGDRFNGNTHKGLIRQQFSRESLKELKGKYGIGAVSSNRQPLSELSKTGGQAICYDGNFVNGDVLKEELLRNGEGFSGYHNPNDVNDTGLFSRLISKEITFEKGIESVINKIQGDFSVICLRKEGIYASRGWGRKPLILGQKDEGYAVASESNSFMNTGFEIVRNVEPGEVVLLNEEGIQEISKFDLKPIKFGTFEWVYTAYPPSDIDGKNVAQARIKLGSALARRFPVDADFISPFPNSGRWHAFGYSHESNIPNFEVFGRFDYSDRSYMPENQDARNEEARTKLIPIREFINGKRIVLIDDSIVRGTQTFNQVRRLKDFGVKEVHLRIACPPLMSSCKYGKSTKKDEDCIARRMSSEEIQTKLGVDSLGYATIEDLEEGIGFSREKLCLECWIR